MKKKGFTLIELLVAIAIVGIISGFSLVAFQGARESSRDAKRRTDLETIRTALELYRADQNVYPSTLPDAGTSLQNPSGTKTYLNAVPGDPTSGAEYLYISTGTSYELCAHQEKGGTGVSCGGYNACGSNYPCYYKVVNP